jgi:hypothetical protein
MGGYGQMPDIRISTHGPRFYELCSNALNTNNDSQGFNKDVLKSLTSAESNLDGVGYQSNDISNFVIALPVEMDFTYQQGQTSNTSVNYELQAECGNDSPYRAGDANGALPVLMGFMMSTVLGFQLRGDGQPPIVGFGPYDISSPG